MHVRHIDLSTASYTLFLVEVYPVCRARWAFYLLHQRSAFSQTCARNGTGRLQQSKPKTLNLLLLYKSYTTYAVPRVIFQSAHDVSMDGCGIWNTLYRGNPECLRRIPLVPRGPHSGDTSKLAVLPTIKLIFSGR